MVLIIICLPLFSIFHVEIFVCRKTWHRLSHPVCSSLHQFLLWWTTMAWLFRWYGDQVSRWVSFAFNWFELRFNLPYFQAGTIATLTVAKPHFYAPTAHNSPRPSLSAIGGSMSDVISLLASTLSMPVFISVLK